MAPLDARNVVAARHERDEREPRGERGGAGRDGRAARWREEAGYFDALAEGMGLLDPAVLRRYVNPRRTWHAKEWRFLALGRLDGKAVLDVGCGAGDNAVMLALRGARVTGVDVSPRSIQVAERRARASGARVAPRFVCAPVETADLPERGFDVIWGDGVLHHLIPELDAVLARLARLARPGARFVFSEPVNLVPALRRLRLVLPIPVNGTSSERPLEEPELAMIRRQVPDLSLRMYGLLGRLNRFVVPGGLERAPAHRRLLAEALCLADRALLSREPLARAGGTAVLWGTFPRG
jgi:2-polyprenyl-3-methyl-5-hydroxy-6-metoxy-1,4-benzoquinol methylase